MPLTKALSGPVAGLLFAGTVLSHPALAHDGDHPIAGEHDIEPASYTDEFLKLLVPEAEAAADFTVKGSYRYISANGYPYKAPGKFPNSGNPHTISRKNYQLKVPVNPTQNGRATSANGTPFGIALNGVLFDPATAEFWQNNRSSGWNYEANSKACKLGLDTYNAHVQPDGTYHYHGVPTGLLASAGGKSTPALIGYAADGFPIYGPYGYSNPKAKSSIRKLNSSYRVKGGTRPSGPGGKYNGTFTQDWTYVAGSGDLDQCNGRFAVTPEYPNGTYHYVLTDSFPHIPRCWMGSPDQSFARLKARGGGQRRGDLQDDMTPDLETTVMTADLISEETADLILAQSSGGRERFLLPGQHPPPPGGRPPQGFGPREGGPQAGGRPGGSGGRSPCSGS
ncbi:YHYH protein [Roseibium sediminis]|uniref:YHYH protein n=1 Tax=Roseibium sediminis TaxID=1775174 RepID=UPI00123D0FBB|nr:YHYH protein [Roseibium sediminis]